MRSLQDLIRPNIQKLKPYSSARDEYKGVDATVFLDANENPYNAPVNRYPDPLQSSVKRLLSSIKGVGESSIFLGNGSDEAIDLIYRIFCEPGIDNVISLSPTYGMYEVCADINNVSYRAIPLRTDEEGNFTFVADDLLHEANGQTKAIFLCSPNNPTGGCLPRAEIEKILTSFDGIVVIDEAYGDFMDEPSYLTVLSNYPNLIVLQTFSKAWACAGIRLGMAFASPEIISYFNKVKYPYNVNILTQQKAISILTGYPQIAAWVEELKGERSRLINALLEYPETEHIFPTDANFVLVRVKDAQSLYDYLLTQGIIVRNRHRIQLCTNCLRITVGTPQENDALLSAMHQYLNR